MRAGILRGAAAACAVAGILALGVPALACDMMGMTGNPETQAQAGTQTTATAVSTAAVATTAPATAPAPVVQPVPARAGFWTWLERALTRGWDRFLATVTQTLRLPLAFRLFP